MTTRHRENKLSIKTDKYHFVPFEVTVDFSLPDFSLGMSSNITDLREVVYEGRRN